MKEGKGKIISHSGKTWLYISRDVSIDSAFPFEGGEKVTVRIEGSRLIVEKEKK